VETTLDAAEALGNTGNAVKPLLGVLFTDLPEGALEEIGLASSGLGLLATAASLGWQLWGAAKQEAVNTADNAKFLERGLGLTPAWHRRWRRRSARRRRSLQRWNSMRGRTV
jgi:hypothetical protein